MGYQMWASKLEELIEIPDERKYKFIKKGTYGARCYPQKKSFVSQEFKQLRCQFKGEQLYQELLKSKGFIFNADASSMYPASMRGTDFMAVRYPVKFSRWSKSPKHEFDNKRIGFYEIDYVPPNNIRVPRLPKRKVVNGVFAGIEWDLLPGSGVYTSVDIEDAMKMGYEITFVNECLVWEATGDVFRDYIDCFYQMKRTADAEKNDVKRNIAKLFMNSLYGKMLQKAIDQTTTIVNNVKDFNKFAGDYNINNFNDLNSNKLLVSGVAKDFQEKITKPCEVGAVVLAYSRRIMQFYMKLIDPTFRTFIFTYTDTDSLHIIGEHYFKLKELGYILPKEQAKLCYMCSDIDHNGLIFNEKNLAPKLYTYSYINDQGEIKEGENAIMKSKGIPKKCLQKLFYDDETAVTVPFNTLKTKNKTLTCADKQTGVKNFSIVSQDCKRTFYKSTWKGMQFVDNEWYPFGYSFESNM